MTGAPRRSSERRRMRLGRKCAKKQQQPDLACAQQQPDLCLCLGGAKKKGGSAGVGEGGRESRRRSSCRSLTTEWHARGRPAAGWPPSWAPSQHQPAQALCLQMLGSSSKPKAPGAPPQQLSDNPLEPAGITVGKLAQDWVAPEAEVDKEEQKPSRVP